MKRMSMLCQVIGIAAALAQIVGCTPPQDTVRKQTEVDKLRVRQEQAKLNMEQNWSKLQVGQTPPEVEGLIGPFDQDDLTWKMVKGSASAGFYGSGETIEGYDGRGFILVFANGKLKSWQRK